MPARVKPRRGFPEEPLWGTVEVEQWMVSNTCEAFFVHHIAIENRERT